MRVGGPGIFHHRGGSIKLSTWQLSDLAPVGHLRLHMPSPLAGDYGATCVARVLVFIMAREVQERGIYERLLIPRIECTPKTPTEPDAKAKEALDLLIQHFSQEDLELPVAEGSTKTAPLDLREKMYLVGHDTQMTKQAAETQSRECFLR